MFTGIIEGLGTIREIRQTGQGKRLGVDADFDLDQTKISKGMSTTCEHY